VNDESLDRLCLDRIARFKRPRRYVAIAELPKNHYGKVLKTELRKQALSATPDSSASRGSDR
jgi:long-chain acyl-CoA synthetase